MTEFNSKEMRWFAKVFIWGAALMFVSFTYATFSLPKDFRHGIHSRLDARDMETMKRLDEYEKRIDMLSGAIEYATTGQKCEITSHFSQPNPSTPSLDEYLTLRCSKEIK